MEDTLSVSELNSYIKCVLTNDDFLQNVCVIGEISNFKQSFPSGHIYFSLKDDKSVIKSVIFRQYINNIILDLENGMKVLIYGYISCYVNSGQYQLYACRILPAGKGEINEALNKLKEKFTKEGLFDPLRKKKNSKYPQKIGVITSISGAVIHDIKSVLNRRYPLANIIIYPVRVQGKESSKEIIKALKTLDLISEIDTIILARGGGSLEELWAFNEEAVVRAVTESSKVTISAVGHDSDYTLCDLAADLRAPTPSVAAELASVDIFESLNLIKNLASQIGIIINSKISKFKQKNEFLKENLRIISKNMIAHRQIKLNNLKNKLENLDPFKILVRGYALVSKDNKIIKDPTEIEEGDNIKLIFSTKILEFKISNFSINPHKN
ncbi:MAG: exodeoxyribonuclease VII large subunit [Candidatus Improbicoccus devescovinae]|nr:MAG: exodeoxyribonuclease VII large subunit [Candidatus Improbicoccus devescovinae]